MTRHLFISGSSRGLGKAIALRLAQDDWQLTLHGRTASAALLDTVAEVTAISRHPVHYLCFDVGDEAASRAALEQHLQTHPAFYGVVLNAGISCDGAFPALSSHDWRSVIDTSLNGFYNVLQPLSMPMVRLKQGGRIVTMASVSGLAGNRGQTNYSAAKGGIIAASKALALELAKRRITVNCVAPGLIATDMVTDEVIAHALPMIPLQRLGQADEVAALVQFLLSDNAAYITRQVISINGGML
ncbi:3-oxoacyl-ACP reductase FabG [Vitreoscilla massiliensis]|uniref:3-oxoacyl-ACP reductase FabG n=1 Tax=Vitreoscilla massiliensis TaxID=1689272 RepID=A0ABY4E3S9_9NEIS|nr:3-oxoacyl-ACP reductase FabG [Vitreoscilla massiliensis]UOO90036.1 3-oxoacyl-ACP reductase FabG [Vitreoscilla massiliensis]